MTASTGILPIIPRLRVFRQLNVSRLSPEFIEEITEKEGTAEYVDSDKPRDLPWTEEIIENTIGAILVNPEGETLASFEGPDGWMQAQRVRASARVTFDIDLEDTEDDAEV